MCWPETGGKKEKIIRSLAEDLVTFCLAASRGEVTFQKPNSHLPVGLRATPVSPATMPLFLPCLGHLLLLRQ